MLTHWSYISFALKTNNIRYNTAFSHDKITASTLFGNIAHTLEMQFIKCKYLRVYNICRCGGGAVLDARVGLLM